MRKLKKPRAPKKSSTEKYRKRRKRELENKGENTRQRVQREVEFKQRIQPRSDAPLVCPLCNQPITEADLKGNIHTVHLGQSPVRVHKSCPGEEA